jgi:hypothetical protein
MFLELASGFLVWVTIFLFIISIGNEMFARMIEHQALYLLLIVDYAPFPTKKHASSSPEPVSRYVPWALGTNTDPVRCVHVWHTGRFRYGKTGRWLKINGEAVFSLATPGFVWHVKITYFPGIWIEAFDYYVHREAGMNLNLFSVFPLANVHNDEIKSTSLFRYLASAPLFPISLVPGIVVEWLNVSESTSRAVIRDSDLCAEALVHFDGSGRIQNIEACNRNHPETGRPVPGHFMKTFSNYTDVQGYKIPLQISSDMILADGEYAGMEITITRIEFNIHEKICRSGS